MFFMPILYSFFPLFFCQFVLLQNTVRKKKKKSIKMPLRFKINMLLKSLELFSTLTVVVIQSYTHDKTAPIHTLKWLQQHWWNLNGVSGCINASILVVILHWSHARCYHQGRLGEGYTGPDLTTIFYCNCVWTYN